MTTMNIILNIIWAIISILLAVFYFSSLIYIYRDDKKTKFNPNKD